MMFQHKNYCHEKRTKIHAFIGHTSMYPIISLSLSTHPSTQVCNCLSICPSTHASVYPSTHPSTCLCVYIYLPVHLSIHSPTYTSVYLSTYPFIHPSIYLKLFMVLTTYGCVLCLFILTYDIFSVNSTIIFHNQVQESHFTQSLPLCFHMKIIFTFIYLGMML